MTPPRRQEPRDPKRLAETLERLMGTLDAPSVNTLDAVFSDWAGVVGADVAAHTRPTALDGDQLSVAARDAAWADEFRWLESMVLERVAAVTGTDRIRRLRVRVDPRFHAGS